MQRCLFCWRQGYSIIFKSETISTVVLGPARVMIFGKYNLLMLKVNIDKYFDKHLY